MRSLKRVLAIDPFSRGAGFAVLEGPDNLIDWGLKTTRRADNKKAVRAIESLIGRFRPDVLALEDWKSAGSRRCSRVQKLLGRITANGRKHVRVRLISRRHLRAIGPLPRAATKYGRARFLAERFPELQPFLPRFRKIWMPEDERTAVFDAAGFALACFPRTAPAADPPQQTLA